MLMRSRTLVATGALLALALSGGCAKDSEPQPLARLDTLIEQNQQLREQVATLSQEVRRLRKRADDTNSQVVQLEETLAKAQEDLRSRLAKLVSKELAGRRRLSGHAIPIKVQPLAPKGAIITTEPWVGGGTIIINGVDAPVGTGTVIIKPDALRIEKLPKKPKPK